MKDTLIPIMNSAYTVEEIDDEILLYTDRKRKLLPIPFSGWPQKGMKELEKTVSLSEVLTETFLPSSW